MPSPQLAPARTSAPTTPPARPRCRATLLRRGVVALVVLAAALGLAACQQPLPDITVQSGAFSTTVKPSTYCYDVNQCRTNSRLDLPVVNIKPNASVLVDVPRVVSNQWQVQVLGGTNGTTLLATSGPIHSNHSYRLSGLLNGGNAYIVAVDKLTDGRPDGSRWSFIVRLVATST